MGCLLLSGWLSNLIMLEGLINMDKNDNVKAGYNYKVFVSSAYCDNAQRRKVVQDAIV